MSNKFSGSLRNSILEEKNKIDGILSPQSQLLKNLETANSNKILVKPKTVIQKNDTIIVTDTNSVNIAKLVDDLEYKDIHHNKTNISLVTSTPKKHIFNVQTEFKNTYKSILKNANSDLAMYINKLPVDGNLVELAKLNLDYVSLMQKRQQEVISETSNLYKSFLSVFMSKV
jgi:hypothetical protein